MPSTSKKHRSRVLDFKLIHVLDIPDNYQYLDAELIELLNQAAAAILMPERSPLSAMKGAMIDEEQAKTLVLRYLDGSSDTEPFVIQSCTLSKRSDYWIIRANSEAYVVRGMLERCYVGVNAYLVDTVSGEIDLVVNSCSVDDHLQDIYDAAVAGTMHYVLGPAFGKDDKHAIIRLRQKIECSLQQAMKLVSSESSDWLTGQRRTLCRMQAMLLREGIAAKIQLRDSALSAEFVTDSTWFWDQLKAVLKQAAEK